MTSPNFPAIRAAGATLTEISEQAHDYMLGVLPPIYARGCWAMGEPVTHVADGPTFYWCAARGDRFFACYGTRRDAETAFGGAS